MEFVASLVHSLAWPITMLAAVVVLRRSVSMALAKGIRRLKVGPSGLEIDFDVVDALRASVEQEQAALPRATEGDTAGAPVLAEGPSNLAKIEASPTGSFVASFMDLERSLRQALLRQGVDVTRLTGHQLGELAQAQRVLAAADREAFEQLRAARNEVVHGMSEELTVGQSLSLVALAEALQETVTRRLKGLESK